jgi:hypothetical protein
MYQIQCVLEDVYDEDKQLVITEVPDSDGDWVTLRFGEAEVSVMRSELYKATRLAGKDHAWMPSGDVEVYRRSR